MPIRFLSALVLFLLTPPLFAQLTCPAPAVHAGKVRTGVALRQRYVLVNSTRLPISISEIKPGCGCLKPSVDHRQLAPGEHANVQLEVQTVTQPAGRNSWRVRVFHRVGEAEHELPLHLTADLQADVSLQPASLILHTATPITHTLTLTEHRNQPLEIHAANASLPGIRVQVDAAKREGEDWKRRVQVEVLTSCPEGRHEGIVCLYTTDANCPELKVPLTVVKRVRSRIEASPQAVELLALGSRSLPARMVLLGSHEGSAVLIDRVEPLHPAIRCTFAAGPGVRSTLRVLVDREKLPAGPFESQVRVHLRQPVGEVVVVPVTVTR